MDWRADSIADKVSQVRHGIRSAAERAGRDPDRVRLVAATKLATVDRIEQAIAAGVTILGENRLQEALPKMEALGRHRIAWHFIGRLQRRKVKSVVGRFELIHSVDSVALAQEIDRRAAEMGIQQAVLLEINIGGEASKGGFAPETVVEACRHLGRMPNVTVRGLMVIPPLDPDPQRTRAYFRRIRELAQTLVPTGLENMAMDELSMGMSADYPLAVEEGATFVRVGTAIFGARA